MQTALLEVKRKFGRNAVIKAMDMEDGATGQDRNRQIGRPSCMSVLSVLRYRA